MLSLCDSVLFQAHYSVHEMRICCLCLFFLEKGCVYLDAEHLYDHIKQEMFQKHAPPPPTRKAGVKVSELVFENYSFSV